MLKAFRILFNLIIIFIFLALAGVIYLRTGLPRTNGTLLFLDLKASVEIIRDRYNIPHIYAENDEDAYFALGFVHAQDRLWQMEFQRRLGAGRLSEFIGDKTLNLDKFFRTLSIYNYAKDSFANLDTETQSILQAYTKGVNAYLDNHSGPLPPEFLIFGHKPESWQPVDSLVWLKMMAWDLSNNWDDEILRARLTSVLSEQEIEQLFAPYPDNAPTILPDFQVLYEDLAFDKFWTIFPKPLPPGAGSNAWVVSGEKTVTGKPLLANDPHLRLQAPSVWYFAHIKTPDFDAIGATLPGLPTIVLGHNNFVSWGIANVPADNQDLFIERLDPTDKNSYLTPDGKERFMTHREIIKVKGRNSQYSVTLKIRQSKHGPIISDVSDETNSIVLDANRIVNREFEHAIAFAWTALREDDLTFQAGLNFLKAKNAQEFASSLNNFHSPNLSIVYADVEGNIGYYAPGRVPLRANGNGLMPVPGWTGEYDWQGFVPFEELPNAINPASGQIVSANHKIVTDDYPYLISSSWAEPYRAKRIEEMLANLEKHTPESFAQIQADQFSLMAQDFLPFLLAVNPESPEKQEAIEKLQAWDGRMSAELAEPLIFYTWYKSFSRLIYVDELSEELFNDTWGFRPIFLESVLSTHSKWCNNILTFVQESCNDIAEQAFNEAFEELTEKHGKNISAWKWGDSHKVKHAHNIFSKTLLNYIFDINKINGGDAFTVNVGRFDIESKNFTQTHGATLRAIYDLANLDNSRFIHTTGQSGHPLSLHYRDFARKWLDVDYIPMNTVRPVVEEGMIGKLVLKPLIPR